MLRRDTTARFEVAGFWIFQRFHFTAGKMGVSYEPADYNKIYRIQKDKPVLIMSDRSRQRTWWMFRDEFYWEDDGYDATAVKALIRERQTQRDRRVRRAVALMEQTEVIAEPARQPIPDDVRAFVWSRDGGRCVRCGSQERLEFDHVIPIALGGSNTARNLQVLCEACNRAKGASLV